MKQITIIITSFCALLLQGLLVSCETGINPPASNPGISGSLVGGISTGWQPLILDLVDDLHDIQFINEQSGWIVGKNQTLLATASGDLGWSRAPVVLPLENLTSVFFINDQTGWVTGDLSGSQQMGQIGFSGNGGSYPVQLEIFDKPLNTIFFLDGNSGWVAGGEGLLARTLNGGYEWEIIPSFTSETIYDMGFTSENYGWVVTGNSGIYHTIDGINWSEEALERKVDILSLHILDENNVWACGNYNTILKRKADPNGVIYWQNTPIDGVLPNMRWNDIFFSDQSTGWVVGNFGLIYKSTDGGESWRKEASNVFDHLQAIHMVNNKRGWAVGDDGTILSFSSE
jgi:photosystem II stability/assembly factor-like uncharacterized protein